MPQPADRRLVTEETLADLNASNVSFTPGGSVGSVNVQLAIEEVADGYEAGDDALQAQIDAIETGGTDRLIPVDSYLPIGFTPLTDDIAPYIQAILDSIDGIAGHVQLLWPNTAHLWDSTVFMISASPDRTYEIVGYGKSSQIVLGPGLDSTADGFAIFVNADSGGGQIAGTMKFPRLRVKDLKVLSSGTDPSFIYADQASTELDSVRFVAPILYGVKEANNSYTDLRTYRKCEWRTQVSGNALHSNPGSGTGDGFVMDQCTAGDESYLARLTNSHGAVFRSCIGGIVKLTNCDAVKVESHHIDTNASGDGQKELPSFIISGTGVTFDRCWDHVSDFVGAPTYQINDDTAERPSDVVFDGCQFGFSVEPGNGAKIRRATLDVIASQPGTSIGFRDCTGAAWARGTAANRNGVGPLCTGSGSAPWSTAFAAMPHGTLGSVKLRMLDASTVRVEPDYPALVRVLRKFSTPTLAAAGDTTWPTALAADTYYYRVAVIENVTRNLWTDGATEVSQSASGTSTVKLTVTLDHSPATVRVWRGTSAGTYDRYVDIPVGAYTTKLYDLGPTLGGYSWITTGVPSVPGTNTTCDGEIIRSKTVINGSGTPPAGAWNAGDQVWKTSPSAGGSPGWVCTAAGSPGTWKAMAAVAA